MHACQGPTYSQIWRTCTDHLSYNGTPKPIHVRPCSQCTANPYGKSVPGCTDQNFGAKVANSWANLDCWLPHFWRSSLLKFWLTCVKDEQLVIRSTDNIQVYPSLSWIYVATKKTFKQSSPCMVSYNMTVWTEVATVRHIPNSNTWWHFISGRHWYPQSHRHI